MRLFFCTVALAAGLARGGALQAQQGAPPGLEVREISFKGNRAIDDLTLSISIASSATPRPSIMRIFPFSLLPAGEERYFDENEFRRDVLRIELLYHQSGYFEAQVDTIVRRGQNDVRITFAIDEGRPVRIREVSVRGTDAILPPREILRDLPLQVGDPFNRFLLQASADTIRSMLENQGHPFVVVYRSFDENRVARDARVAFEVDPGARARVDSVEVVGTERISPNVVRRSLAVRAGQVFRRDALYQSQRELYRMDLFSYVTVGLVDSLPSGPDDSTVTIRVQVTEGKLRRIRAGAGYGALDCVRGLANWTGRDLLGGVRSLDLTGRVSKIGASLCRDLGLSGFGDQADSSQLKLNYNFTAALREPFVLSRRTSAAFSVFAERHSEVNAFTRTDQGGELSLTARVAWDVPVTLSYALTYGQTEAADAVFCTYLNVCGPSDIAAFKTRRRESVLGLAVVDDRSNSPLDPSRGRVLSAQLRYASVFIGSDSLSDFTKGVAEVASYHRLGRRGVFAWRVRAGAILPAELGLGGRVARFAPLDERLYAGGPNTVRGYGQNGLGPLVRVIERVDTAKASAGDPDSLVTRASPTGGYELLVANAEVRAPIPGFAGRLQGALFVDAGQVYSGDLGALNQPIRVTPGAGLRVMTPLGPIRVDVAYNPADPTPGPLYDPRGGRELLPVQDDYAPPPARSWWGHLQWHFSVGQAF
ncbi:MAG: BamA/TamA family outer membrane protein [Gemmatimonadetes bacterium]|nr:BamA/TamA family outer membrane protein [Gemmatimonadota bacterium]